MNEHQERKGRGSWSVRSLDHWALRLAAAGLLAVFTWGAMSAAGPRQPPSPLQATVEATATAVPVTPTVTPPSTPVPRPTPVPLASVPVPARPSFVGPDERWVDVNLGALAASAMVGDSRVRLAYVTTGKPGWETPRGAFTIWRRVENETMTSASLGLDPSEEYYTLDNVLYTQYFDGAGDALHLNYWQPDEVFGREPRSHGCVGMRLDDAAYFWEFADIGTRVAVHP